MLFTFLYFCRTITIKKDFCQKTVHYFSSKCKSQNLTVLIKLRSRWITLSQIMPIITPLDFKEEIRKLRDQSPKLPPLNQRNGSPRSVQNFYRMEENLPSESLILPDISTAAKRRSRPKRKVKKNVKKHPANGTSTEMKNAKKRKPPSVGKLPGEITKSFSVISSARGSHYLLIQRRSSPRQRGKLYGKEHDL